MYIYIMISHAQLPLFYLLLVVYEMIQVILPQRRQYLVSLHQLLPLLPLPILDLSFFLFSCLLPQDTEDSKVPPME